MPKQFKRKRGFRSSRARSYTPYRPAGRIGRSSFNIDDITEDLRRSSVQPSGGASLLPSSRSPGFGDGPIQTNAADVSFFSPASDAIAAVSDLTPHDFSTDPSLEQMGLWSGSQTSWAKKGIPQPPRHMNTMHPPPHLVPLPREAAEAAEAYPAAGQVRAGAAGELRKCIAVMRREIKGLVRMRAGVEREKGAWLEESGSLRRQLGELGQ